MRRMSIAAVAGEIYLVTLSSPIAPGGLKLKFLQLWSERMGLGSSGPDGRCVMDVEDSTAWWMRFGLYRRPVIRAFHSMEAADASPSSFTISDGPMREEGIRRKIVGRVVRGDRCPSAAGLGAFTLVV